MAISRAQNQNQMKGNKGISEGKYEKANETPVQQHRLTNKPTGPTMAHYIEASKEPRHTKRGTEHQRQAKTFGKNG